MKLPKKGHPLWRYITVNLTLALLLFLFLLLDRFSFFDAFLLCPLHLIGIYCPTCGITRATHALLRLDLAAAMTYHPLIPLLVALVLYYEVYALFLSLRGETGLFRRAGRWPIYTVGALFLLFFLLRNALLLAGIDPVGDFIP
jgi:hypothetical protein